MNFLKKIFLNLEEMGFIKTFLKILFYPFRRVEYLLFLKKIKKLDSKKEKFEFIHENNVWKSSESLSGEGSTIKSTENVRLFLPKIFEKFGINNFFDAPCGDLNWMKLVLDQCDINYIGGDIVENLVDDLNKNFSSDSRVFINIDITKDKLPDVDLMMVRDCLFHFSYGDIFSFLKNFKQSNIKFLLTTSHKTSKNYKNKNIDSGDFRLIDLFKEPFCFKSNFVYQIEDYIKPFPERSLYLWKKEDIPDFNSIEF